MSTVKELKTIAKTNKIKNFSSMRKGRLMEAILNNETLMDCDSLSRSTSFEDVSKLLKQQNNQCKNRPIQKALGVPGSYICPQWKYNQGYLEKDERRYIFDIDHINDFSESKDNSFENKQILCLYCHRMKTNHRKKYKTLSASEVNDFKPAAMTMC